MENVIAHFGLKDEDDYMYKRGEAKTEARFQKILADQKAEARRKEVEAQKRLEQTQRFTVIELLDAATLTEDQIQKVFEVTAEFIQDIKNDLVVAPKKIARLKKTLTAEQIARQLQLPINWVEKQLEQA